LNKERQGDKNGYDAIGSFVNMTYGIQGSGVEMGALLLDNQSIGHNRLVKKLAQKSNLLRKLQRILLIQLQKVRCEWFGLQLPFLNNLNFIIIISLQ
jgi:hypothetical protein